MHKVSNYVTSFNQKQSLLFPGWWLQLAFDSSKAHLQQKGQIHSCPKIMYTVSLLQRIPITIWSFIKLTEQGKDCAFGAGETCSADGGAAIWVYTRYSA